MEDNVQSHGTRSAANVSVKQYKAKAEMAVHPHPPESPNLDPIEGVWLLLNKRLKKHRLWGLSVDEFKDLIQHEWWFCVVLCT